MSNYHIKKQSKEQHRVDVVFHLLVPVETNSASKSLSNCLKEDKNPTTAIPWLIDPELSQVANGEIYEHTETFQFSNARATLALKKAELDSRWNTLNSALPAKIRNVYEWWGRDEDV